jgi:modulator of FtsH protease HflK
VSYRPLINYDQIAESESSFDAIEQVGVVRLQATIFYQITDAVAYVLAVEHIKPALQRLFAASAVAVCAARDLDAIIMARAPVEADVGCIAESRQERVRADLLAAVNRRLAALTTQGTGLGVAVSRVDLTASLPAAAKAAFDEVLTAIQRADRDLAETRADAARTMQLATQERERILAEAAALAAERRTEARTHTASIVAVDPQYVGEARTALINRIYYERAAALLKKAGRIDAVDPHSSGQLYLPGRSE